LQDGITGPPIITFWNFYEGVKIQKGTVIATFSSWKDFEKANKDVLTPLQILFSQDGIESVYGLL